jgi:hypothetical protein
MRVSEASRITFGVSRSPNIRNNVSSRHYLCVHSPVESMGQQLDMVNSLESKESGHLLPEREDDERTPVLFEGPWPLDYSSTCSRVSTMVSLTSLRCARLELVPQSTVPRYTACLLRHRVVSLFRPIHIQGKLHVLTMTSFIP